MTWPARRRSRSLVAALTGSLVAGALLLGAAPAKALSIAGDGPVPSGTPTTTGPHVRPQPRPAAPRATPRYPWRGLALGDSVMSGARVALRGLNYTVDAVGSRQPSAGYTVLAAYGRRLPGLVVVHMGTNGGITRRWFDRYMTLLGPKRRVVWVTLQLRNNYSRYTYEDRSNAMLRTAVKAYPNARLMDWNRLSQPHMGTWFWGDGIHLTPAGRRAFARFVNAVARA